MRDGKLHRPASLLLALVILCSSSPLSAADYAKDPVLMVHGYFLPDFATWASIEGKLVDDGWPAEFLFGQTFDSVVGCNPSHGEAVAASVDMIREVTGRDKVDLLTHSMGGLDCRYYIKYLCGYKYVKDVVMLAGANHGSVIACLDPLSCGAEQMCIDSGDAWADNPFLADLNACDATPGDEILYTSIWTEFDEIIVPQEGSELPGAVNHELDSFAAHGTILLSDEAYQWVKAGLDGGGANDVGPDGEGPCVTVCEDPAEPGPETVEATPDVAELDADVVETVETVETVEEICAENLDVPPEITASDSAGAEVEISGDGLVEDGLGPGEDSGPTGPVYHLPAAKSGGCGVGAATGGSIWWLLLLLWPLLQVKQDVCQGCGGDAGDA